MTRRQWMAVWVFAVTVVRNPWAFADSVWDRRDDRSAYLWRDNRARRIGDLLTVTVSETTDATNTEQRKMQKDTAISGKFDFAGKTGGNAAGNSASANVSADNSTDRSFQGSAQFQSNRQLLDNMQVRVVDVLPNGNLVIEGMRWRHVADETRLIRISGVVRPNDIDIPGPIGSQNTVSSHFIENFKIDYIGGGVESRFTGQGWLGRLTNKVWPY